MRILERQINLLNGWGAPFSWTPQEFLTWITQQVSQIPAEHRDSAVIKWEDSGSEERSCELSVCWSRPQTAAELAAELAGDAARKARGAPERYAQFLLLKQEFER